jgi:hypothetical protein
MVLLQVAAGCVGVTAFFCSNEQVTYDAIRANLGVIHSSTYIGISATHQQSAARLTGPISLPA